MPLSLEEMSRRFKIHLIRNRSRKQALMATAAVFLVTSYVLGVHLLTPAFVPWLLLWASLARLSDQAALFHADAKILSYQAS